MRPSLDIRALRGREETDPTASQNHVALLRIARAVNSSPALRAREETEPTRSSNPAAPLGRALPANSSAALCSHVASLQPKLEIP